MEQFFDFSFSPLLLVLCALALVFFVQLFYYLVIFTKVSGYVPQIVGNHTDEPVSIIICARNEEDNLMKHLPLLLNQNYDSKFEVIVVNDCSFDESYEKMLRMQPDYAHL